MQRYPWKKEFAGGEKYSSAGVDPSGSAGKYRNTQMERLGEFWACGHRGCGTRCENGWIFFFLERAAKDCAVVVFVTGIGIGIAVAASVHRWESVTARNYSSPCSVSSAF
jgi:hypothetical protein